MPSQTPGFVESKMDTQAPTTLEKLEHQVEEGIFDPAPTPADSDTTRSAPRARRSTRRRSETQFIAHEGRSPLHASSSRSRTPRSGVETPEEQSDEDPAPRPSTDEKGRARHSFRRSRLSSKRSSRKGDATLGTQRKPSESWVTNLRRSRYNPSIVLKNSGAVARDHLASERTFLAYVRTSMGLASMGVALVQLFAIAEITSHALGTNIPAASPDVQRFARPLGALTIALSFAVLLIGLYRYFKIQFALPGGNFPVARISVTFTAFVFAGIVVTIFGAVLSGRAH